MKKNYVASYMPFTREVTVYSWGGSKRKPTALTLDAFGLSSQLQEGDHLWLMMGSINTSVALGAFRDGVIVHQLSYSRVRLLLESLPKTMATPSEEEGVAKNGSGECRTKVTPYQVYLLATSQPELFYLTSPQHSDVLEILDAWQEVDEAMEARKAYANRRRQTIIRSAVGSHSFRGVYIITSDELKLAINKEVGTTMLEWIVDEKTGKEKLVATKKKEPEDLNMRAFIEKEEEACRRLESVCRRSEFYKYVFGSIEGIGPKLAARLVTAIERIERFKEPTDLSNYGGFLPRGKDGRLPSRRFASIAGIPLNRSGKLNNAGFCAQDQWLVYGAKTPLGKMLHDRAQELCLCTAEERRADKELRSRYGKAVKMARTWVTRYLLEKLIWPRWTAYMKQ